MSKYALRKEPEYDTPWIAAPNNGGDIGDMSDIVDELNKLMHERNALFDALRKAVTWADCIAQRITEDRWNINWSYLEQAREVLQQNSGILPHVANINTTT